MNYELKLCKTCSQMTNHIGNKCQKHKMKLHEFYAKYDNTPLVDRNNPRTYYFGRMISTISLYSLCELIKEQDDIIGPAQAEIDRLLKIAEQIMR